MKKTVIGLLVVVALTWLALSFGAKSTKTAVTLREWPMELGRLDSVPARYPKQARSAGAAELERLASAVGIEFAKRGGPQTADLISSYLRRQLQVTRRTIEPAPQIPQGLAAVRAHLLSGQPIVWDVDIAKGASSPIPNLLAHMQLGRLLTASALERARLGDAGAWDDLRAAQELSRGLWKRPELISALIAVAIDRHLIAAARQLPLPPPPWFDEVRTFNHRKATLAAMQADTWMISATIRDYYEGPDPGAPWVRRLIDRTIKAPYGELSRADFVAHQRHTAIQLAALETCALDVPAPKLAWWNQPAQLAMMNVVGAWQRVFRVRAELEATEHALGLRSGPQSQCSDGQWVVTPESVKFTRPIPSPGPGTFVIPLEITP